MGSSFVAFRDFDLWDAWYRVWVVGLLIGTTLNADLYLRYWQTRDRSILDASERPPYSGFLGAGFPEFGKLYSESLALVQEVKAGRRAPGDAAASIRSMMRNLPYVPSYWRWHDPSSRTTPAFTLGGMTRMYFWYLLRAPGPLDHSNDDLS